MDLKDKDIITFEYASGRYSSVVVRGHMNMGAL